MTSTNQSYGASSSAYLNSLVNYVLDIKPYHSKLAQQGAVSEKYLFSDTLHVKMTENERMRVFLGADLLPSIAVPGGNRARLSSGWWKDLISDGHHSTMPMPQISNPIFASSARLQNFTCGIDDYTGIPGLTLGVFDQKRWDGPGITDVRKNNIHQQDTIDYTLSHGAYVFDVIAGGNWKEHDVANVTAFSSFTGALQYDEVARAGGRIFAISGGNYEEWVVKTTFVDSTGTLPAQASVIGSSSGHIGNVTFNQQFTSTRINFFWGPAPGESSETTKVGDIWTLTPLAKITTSPSTPYETWSIIKSNPIALAVPVLFNALPMVDGGPALEVHTRSLDQTIEDVTWSVTFNGDGTYTLSRSAVTNPNGLSYPMTISLINGCSFKNIDIAFTIIPTVDGWNASDNFTWTTTASSTNFKVYGTISGWQPDATIGKWYWNGKIGFKIPSLKYFTATLASTIATSIAGIQGSWFNVVQSPQTLTSITFQNGGFYASGNDSIVAASADGSSWTSDVASVFHPVPFSNELLVITGENGLVAASTDGVVWGIQQTNITFNLKATTQIPNFLASQGSTINDLNCIIVVGDKGTIITSINATGWAIQESGVTTNLNAVTWTNSTVIASPDTRAIIAVGSNGTILRSTDRIVWTVIPSGTTEHLNSVIYEPTSGVLIIVGNSGTILRSLDNGLTWLDLNQFSDGNFNSIAYGDGEYVAVGKDGWTARSADGISWSRYSGRAFNAIAYGNGKFVAVGGTANQYTKFTPLRPVGSMAESSVYTITFTTASTDTTPGYATVYNNIYGYRPGLITGQPWADEFCSFQLDTVTANIQYNVGDQVQVFLSPAFVYAGKEVYESLPYELSPYDVGNLDLTVPYLFDTDLFPMYQSHGAVIWHGITGAINGNCVVGDSLVIDKAFYQNVQLQITGSSTNYAELGAVNDWVPLELRYYDNATGTPPNLTPTSNADFSDLATYIEAYSAANPDQLVFSVLSPRFMKTDRSAVSTLTFDPTFFATYLPFNAAYSVKMTPDESYGQHIRVKITENLKIYARINLNVNDLIAAVIIDEPIGYIDITTDINYTDIFNVSIVEGGGFPLGNYDFSLGYDHDYGYESENMIGIRTSSPAKIIGENSVDTGNTGIDEGLSILMTVVNNSYALGFDRAPFGIGGYENGRGTIPPESAGETTLNVSFDFSVLQPTGSVIPSSTTGLTVAPLSPTVPNAAQYIVNMVNATSASNLIVAPESNLGAIQAEPIVFMTYLYTDANGFEVLVTDPNSFIFSLPAGITAPFRLWIV